MAAQPDLRLLRLTLIDSDFLNPDDRTISKSFLNIELEEKLEITPLTLHIITKLA